MLIKRAVLDRIVAGEIDVIFRRWKKPTVKAGGTLRTSVGLLAIDSVDIVPLSTVTAAEAKRAGFPTKAALRDELMSRPTGDIYRIRVRLGGEDPRIALRNTRELSASDIEELTTRLARLDKASKRGPWTIDVLRLIESHPQVRAQDLAESIGIEKDVLKNDVRKLKALGLTISFSPGYELSPRALAYLATLD